MAADTTLPIFKPAYTSGISNGVASSKPGVKPAKKFSQIQLAIQGLTGAK